LSPPTGAPVAAPDSGPGPADAAEYSSRFYLSPSRVGLLSLICGPVYTLWWLWRLYHHVTHERLPRPHSFWTLIVPLYGLKTLSDEFRSVHEEAARVIGKSPFALQAAYILWLVALAFDRVTGLVKGPGVLVYFLLSSAMYAVVVYWVQGAADRYLELRLPGYSHHGLSTGEWIAAILGALVGLLVIAGLLLPG
jgi:hypothetical protein